MSDVPRSNAHLIFQSRRNSRVYAHYVLACGDRAMPRRDEIDPAFMKAELPYVYMTRIAHEEGRTRFLIRLMGTELVEVLKQEGAGRYLGELDLGAFEQEWRNSLLSAYRSGSPVVSIDTVVLSSGLRLSFEHVAMPLSENGKDVDRVFGAFDFPGYRNSELNRLLDKIDWSEIVEVEVPKRLIITNLNLPLE